MVSNSKIQIQIQIKSNHTANKIGIHSKSLFFFFFLCQNCAPYKPNAKLCLRRPICIFGDEHLLRRRPESRPNPNHPQKPHCRVKFHVLYQHSSHLHHTQSKILRHDDAFSTYQYRSKKLLMFFFQKKKKLAKCVYPYRCNKSSIKIDSAICNQKLDDLQMTFLKHKQVQPINFNYQNPFE